jgi:hypothetical protein
MKGEHLCSFVDSAEDKVGLQSKKKRLCESNNVQMDSTKWVILKTQNVKFRKKLSRDETFKGSEWWLWQ